MAEITRDQFVETKLVRRKILQKGSILTDADWNEQADVFERSLRRSLSCLVQHQSMRFGDGFKVEGTGASLAVTVRAGFGAFQFGDDQAVLLQRASDLEISGFAPWTGARTDYVYLKIQQVEISASDDANIVNPDIGEETCRDLRLVVSFHISQGAAPPAAPSGQAHITLASVTKSAGSTIDVGDVTSVVDDFYSSFDIRDGEVTEPKIATGAVSESKIAANAVTAAKIGSDVAGIGLAQSVSGSIGVADDGIVAAMLGADITGNGLSQAGDGSLDVVGVKEDSGAILKIKRLSGTWNMNTTASMSVPHGLPVNSIIHLSVFITANYLGNDYGRRLDMHDAPPTEPLGESRIFNNNVHMTRTPEFLFEYGPEYANATFNILLIYVS